MLNNAPANRAPLSGDDHRALTNEKRKGVFKKMESYLLLALLYGCLSGSYLVLAIHVRSG
jgi:hypothetical protein